MKRSALLLSAVLLLVPSCSCPPKNADGTKPPCRYVGPAISASFQGVTVAFWNNGEPSPRGPIVIPESVLGIPINTK